MDRDQRALLPYRLRAVRVGIAATALAVAALVAYPFIPGSRIENSSGYFGVVTLGSLGMVLVAVLPWKRLFEGRAGIPMLYGWSVMDIGLISVGIAFSGHHQSELWVVYILTTLFFAASYPPGGQVALMGFTAGAYILTCALGGDAATAAIFIRITALALMALIGGFLSL